MKPAKDRGRNAKHKPLTRRGRQLFVSIRGLFSDKTGKAEGRRRPEKILEDFVRLGLRFKWFDKEKAMQVLHDVILGKGGEEKPIKSFRILLEEQESERQGNEPRRREKAGQG